MKLPLAGLCLLLGMQVGLTAVACAQSSAWINITPKENLQEWTRVPIPPNHPLNPVSQWSVDQAHHMIVCQGNRGHEWLRYNHKYKNFIFELEWRLAKVPGPEKYNSGVFVRNSKDGTIWYQAQVGSASGGYWFGDNPVAGALKRINLSQEVKENHVRPAGEWNSYKLRCLGKTLTLWVNGAKQSEFTQCQNSEGYLGLEAEGSRIEFRKLRVKILP